MNETGHTAVVGLQWGDEGKGKIVDLLTEKHDLVVRYNGGANAGHTVVIGDDRYALHLIPSGILSPGKLCVIGNGVVIDPVQILREREILTSRGVAVSPDNLKISSRAHVVMPWHKQLDEALEKLLTNKNNDNSDKSIGTTKRGIGPTYADKITRSTAIRAGDLLDKNRLNERIETILEIKNAQLNAFNYKNDTLNAKSLYEEFAIVGEQISPYICDTTYLLHDRIKQGDRILFEGANATLLDVDHGTYPYVTSSNCTALGIPAGTGVPCKNINNVVGLVKAYATRVGGGPFPTELNDATGDAIRKAGNEYGTTTGRPRRCGWLDLVAVKYAAMICGATSIALSLFDILADMDELKICTAYKTSNNKPPTNMKPNQTTDHFLPDAYDLERIEPVYETFAGFDRAGLENAQSIADLPPNAKRYLDRIEQFVNVPIQMVGIGPERTQTLMHA